MERETGIEPATNSLEGCDSTTELLPPTRLALFADSLLPAGTPPALLARFAASGAPTSSNRRANLHARQRKEGWWGGEGSNLRSPKAAGLQPAAIDRSATSPFVSMLQESGISDQESGRARPEASDTPDSWFLMPDSFTFFWKSRVSLKSPREIVRGAGGGI